MERYHCAPPSELVLQGKEPDEFRRRMLELVVGSRKASWLSEQASRGGSNPATNHHPSRSNPLLGVAS